MWRDGTAFGSGDTRRIFHNMLKKENSDVSPELARLLQPLSVLIQQTKNGEVMTIRKTASTLALAAMFAAGGSAFAQSSGGAGQAPAPGEQTPAAAPMTEKTVDVFVDAFVSVQEIREDFAERLQSASDEAEAQATQQEAQEKMIQAVEQSGMSVQEYNDAAMALQNDPELMRKVQEKAAEQK